VADKAILVEKKLKFSTVMRILSELMGAE